MSVKKISINFATLPYQISNNINVKMLLFFSIYSVSDITGENFHHIPFPITPFLFVSEPKSEVHAEAII